MKYKVVNSSDNTRIGLELDHTQVPPILKVGVSGGVFHTIEGHESYKMVMDKTPSNKEDGSNVLLYAILVILVVLGGVFFAKKK
jgi:hypothetical protein